MAEYIINRRTIMTPSDLLLDKIYSIAYWMTGDEASSRELVSESYRKAETEMPEEGYLFKTFRKCYMERFGQETAFCINKRTCGTAPELPPEIKKWAADIKLSVLLKEIAELRNEDISDILGKPTDTICLWLHWGRKLFAHDEILRASA